MDHLSTVRRQLTAGGWSRWSPDATTLLVSVFAEAGQLPWSAYDEEVTIRAGWCSSPWALPEDEADRGALQSLLAGRSPLGMPDGDGVNQRVCQLAQRMQRWSRLCRTSGAGDQRVLADLHRALVRFGILTDTGPAEGEDRRVGLGRAVNVLDVLPLTASERADEQQAQRVGAPVVSPRPRVHRQRSQSPL